MYILNMMHILHVLFLILPVSKGLVADRALQVLLAAMGSIAMEPKCLVGVKQLRADQTDMLVVLQAHVSAQRFLVGQHEVAEGTREQVHWALLPPHPVGELHTGGGSRLVLGRLNSAMTIHLFKASHAFKLCVSVAACNGKDTLVNFSGIQ